MSCDTMSAHDDGLDEARDLIAKYLTPKQGDTDWCTCGYNDRVLRKIQRSIRVKYEDPSRARQTRGAKR